MRYWVILPLLLIACDNDKPKPTATPAASEKAKPEKKGPNLGLLGGAEDTPPSHGGSAAAAGSDGGTIAEGVVKVLNQGTEPRRELRYAFKNGETETFTYELGTTISHEAGQSKRNAKDQKGPGLRFELTATTTAVSADGTAMVEWSFEKVDVLSERGTSANDVAGARETWEQLKGKIGKSVISPKGVTIAAEFGSKDPNAAQLLGLLRANLTNIVVPLPTEPVGKAAKWQYRHKPASREVANLVQEETFVLSDLAETGGKVARQYDENAPAQEVEAAQMPGRKLLRIAKGVGASTSVFDLMKVVPKSEGSLTQDELIAEATPDGKQTTIQKETVKVTTKFTPATQKKK